MSEPTLALLIPVTDPTIDLKPCCTSLAQQDYPHWTAYVIGQAPTLPEPWTTDDRFQQLTVPDVTLPTLGHLAQTQLTSDLIMIIDPRDQLDQPDSLSELVALAQQLDCDLIMPEFVRFDQQRSTYLFPNLWRQREELITYNNYHFLIRASVAMRVVDGSLIDRHLFAQATATLPREASSQTLIRRLCRQARHGIYTDRHPYIWHLQADHQLPEFEWPNPLTFSQLPQLVAANQAAGYQAPVPTTISIAICIDQNVAATIPTLLYSIATHASRPTDIYVVYDQLPTAARADLTWFNDRFSNFRVILTPLRAVDRDLLRRFTLNGHKGNLTTFYRLVLPQLLPDVERLIYLDADTLVSSDLTALWESDLAGNFLGVIKDPGIGVEPRPARKEDWWGYRLLGPNDGEQYFNAGVLLMDLHLFRQYSISLYFYQFVIETIMFYVLEDQDALNLFFHGAVAFLPLEHNYITKFIDIEPRAIEAVSLLHYLGPRKPWKINFDLPASQRAAAARYRATRRTWQALAHKEWPAVTALVDTATPDDDLLERTLESLLSQDYGPLEIIVTTPTAPGPTSPLTRWAKENPNLTVLVSDAPSRLARQQVARHQASSDLLLCLTAPDYLDDVNTLSQLVALQQKEAASLVCAQAIEWLVEQGRFMSLPNANDVINWGPTDWNGVLVNQADLQPTALAFKPDHPVKKRCLRKNLWVKVKR